MLIVKRVNGEWVPWGGLGVGANDADGLCAASFETTKVSRVDRIAIASLRHVAGFISTVSSTATTAFTGAVVRSPLPNTQLAQPHELSPRRACSAYADLDLPLRRSRDHSRSSQWRLARNEREVIVPTPRTTILRDHHRTDRRTHHLRIISTINTTSTTSTIITINTKTAHVARAEVQTDGRVEEGLWGEEVVGVQVYRKAQTCHKLHQQSGRQ